MLFTRIMASFIVLYMAAPAHAARINAKFLAAAHAGNKQKVEELLKKNADVDARTQEGSTAIMLAAQQGHKEIVKILIDKGADVNAEDKHQMTALTLAIQEGHTEIVDLLKKAGAEKSRANFLPFI